MSFPFPNFNHMFYNCVTPSSISFCTGLTYDNCIAYKSKCHVWDNPDVRIYYQHWNLKNQLTQVFLIKLFIRRKTIILSKENHF